MSEPLMIVRAAGPLREPLLRPCFPEYAVRLATRHDAEAAARVLAMNFDEAGWTEREVIDRFFRSRGAIALFVAYQRHTGLIVGSVAARERWDMGEIAWVSVHPAHRHGGIGTALIRRCVDFLSLNYSHLTGVMNPVQPKVRAFWESHGFEVRPCPPQPF